MDKNGQWTSTFLAVELTALVTVVVLCVLIYTLRKNTLMMHALRDSIERSDEPEAQFFNREQAEQWFETGDLRALNQYCEGFIKTAPNSVHANWYYALSHYNQGDYELAREYFENVIRINPLWRDGAVVYLQEIANKIGLPDSRTVH